MTRTFLEQMTDQLIHGIGEFLAGQFSREDLEGCWSGYQQAVRHAQRRAPLHSDVKKNARTLLGGHSVSGLQQNILRRMAAEKDGYAAERLAHWSTWRVLMRRGWVEPTLRRGDDVYSGYTITKAGRAASAPATAQGGA